MIDYKYHVTSLAAVFLALGVGILIGSLVLGSEFLGSQQEALVNRLEMDFQELRMENGLTRSELALAQETAETYKKICREMMPPLIAGKLVHYRVAVIERGTGANIKDIVDPLEMAGAEVETMISLSNMPSLDQLALTSAQPAGQTEETLVQMMGEALLYGDENNILTDLAEKDLLKLKGRAQRPIDAVIFSGGNDGILEKDTLSMDDALADFFLEKNVPVIGVENIDAAYSRMPYYQTKQMITIDHVDDVPGQIALVYAVLGMEGDFGVKKTAKSLMPDLR